MRLLVPILTLLPTLSLAISRKAQRYASQAVSSPDNVLILNNESYDDLLAEKERDYSVSVVLTAMDAGFKCAPCHEFDPSYRSVASSWARLPKEDRQKHIFASLDFADGQAIYKRLGLSSAPTVFFFPAKSPDSTATDKAPKVVPYDINKVGFSAQPLLNFIKSQVGTDFEIYKPKPWGLIITAPFLIAALSFALFSFRSYLLPIIQSKHLWTLITLLIILTFTTGHMWNKIKGAPYSQTDRQGRTQWMAGGFSNQFGMETHVVATIYGTLAFTIVALTNFVPTIRDPTRQKASVILWTGMLLVIFSILLSIFKMKNGGYPFRLFF